MNKLKSESANSIEAHLAALYQRINYERQERVTPRHFKLQNMREILQRLGDPHLKYPVIHVAGTKGKGSVCTMIGQILTDSGRRTGVYTSPHFEKINQRMAVDGQEISDEQLVHVLSSLDPVVQQMDAEAEQQNHRPLTFFEVTTAAAMYFFADQGCEAVVLEVGLGGRMDSTNVCQPVTTIITNISLDHTRQLGSTVDKIAYEKAGIIKPSIPVVSGATDPAAADVIADVARQNNASLFLFDRDFFIESVADDESFSCRGQIEFPSGAGGDPNAASPPLRQRIDFHLPDLKLNLLGHHQRVNAALALSAIQTLNVQGWNISDEVIRNGLRKANMNGRTERVARKPTIIIDMAHNVASIEALIETLSNSLREWNSSSLRKLIFATSRDKDAPGMLRPLIENFDEIVLTKYQDNPRGKSESELMAIAELIQTELRAKGYRAANLAAEPDPKSAWNRVNQGLKPDHVVCVTGSAFLVAEIRETVVGSPKLCSDVE